MQIFGRTLETREILVVSTGVVGGLGLCYAGYTFFKTLRNSSRTTESGISIGGEDLELPLVLESEYGNFKETCNTADPVASSFLNDLPKSWFNFDQTLLQIINTFLKQHTTSNKRALVIGSGTGKLPFELGKTFIEVRAIDPSFSKIITCFRFQNRTPVTYYFPLEGSYRTAEKILNVQDPIGRPTRNRRGVPIENVEFYNADPCQDFPKQLGEFQSVFVSNSLNKLREPEKLLGKLHRFVESGGLLFIWSDYNWERQTNQHEGFVQRTVTTSFQFLTSILEEHFDLIEQKNVLDVVPESLRSCRITNYHVTIWFRKNSTAQRPPLDDSDSHAKAKNK